MTFVNETVLGLCANDITRPVIIVLDGKSITGELDTLWVGTRRPFGVFKEKKPEAYVLKLAITVGGATVEIDKPDMDYIVQIDRDPLPESVDAAIDQKGEN